MRRVSTAEGRVHRCGSIAVGWPGGNTFSTREKVGDVSVRGKSGGGVVSCSGKGRLAKLV